MQQNFILLQDTILTITGNTQTPQEPTAVPISKEPIRLGQFLKLANTVQDGFEAKLRIADGEVTVNGEFETRRGRKLFHGDTVGIDSFFLEVTLR